MPFDAKVYKVLIASPSDVQDERNAVTQAIHDWNDDHSEAEGISFVPIRWERHSAPELGDTPQELINKYLVDKSDILIALFWSKLGSPTGKEKSGTVEEIKKFLDAGKLAMVYFCQRAIPQDLIGQPQFRKLQAFRKQIGPLGIYHTFNETQDLNEDLNRHLTTHMRRIKKTLSADEGETPGPAPAFSPTESTSQEDRKRALELAGQLPIGSGARQKSRERIVRDRQEFETKLTEHKYHNFQMRRGSFGLSIHPFELTQERIDFTKFSDAQILEMLSQSDTSSVGKVERFRDAVVVRTPFPSNLSAKRLTKLTDRGSLFLAARWFDDLGNDDMIVKWHPNDHWPHVVEDVFRYLTVFKNLRIPSYWTITISLFRMRRTLAVPEYNYEVANDVRINEEDDIHFEPITVNNTVDLSTPKAVKGLLETTYRDIWLQYGYPSRPNFDDKGKFIGMTPVPQ